METKTISTKVNQTAQNDARTPIATNAVLLSKAEADEYRSYKQQQYLSKIAAAISKSQGSLLCGEDVQKTCERAVRLCQAAVQMPLSKLPQALSYLINRKVNLDCVVGGTGETHAKVKAYETRLAVQSGAKEITLVLTPSLVDACRYGEIRREIKRVRRAAGRTPFKVQIEKNYSPTVMSRLARLCSETGVKFFCVPDFSGCEKLRMDLTRGCKLEVFGVQTLDRYRYLVGAGVERMVTNRAMEFYTAWLKECNDSLFAPLPQPPKAVEPGKGENAPICMEKAHEKENLPKNTPLTPPLSCPPVKGGSETDYRCKLDGTQLKFL